MRSFALLSFAAVAGTAAAQTVTAVDNSFSGQPFKYKSSTAEGKVLGPMYKLDSTWTFENPSKDLVEAAIKFSNADGMSLAGFGYWYKTEYVPGVLMDRQKANFIYTSITNINRDPGLAERVSTNNYRAKIYPLAIGYDLRLALKTVGLLPADAGGAYVPQPEHPSGKPTLEIRASEANRLQKDGDKFRITDLPDPNGIDMYAQRFKDGRYYVVGSLGEDGKLVKGLEGVLYARVGEKGRYFAGYRRGRGTVTVTRDSGPMKRRILGNDRGADTAKIWANMKLVQHPLETHRDLLKFILKYQVPSRVTALLAVPKEEMARYRDLAAEYRKMERESDRQGRNWQDERRQNWDNTGGGDPEIRVTLPDAERAYAVLPDGRSFDLFKTKDGFWGGSYDIPSDAPEGSYDVRVVGVRADGTQIEQKVGYQVDRTAPLGSALIEDGKLVVRSEARLARVVAVTHTGTEVDLKETVPGTYILEGTPATNVARILLLDRAHNRTFIAWSR